MTISLQTEVSELLEKARLGEPSAVDALFETVYIELRRAARNYLRDERSDHTLQTTALVHEAYLRLVGGQTIVWQNRAQFFSIAAQVMRHILVDYARMHGAEKRGRSLDKMSLDDAMNLAIESDLNLVALDDALKTLAMLDPEQCKIVELRFFGGLTIKETAELLQISEISVSRKWQTAKLWLQNEIIAGE